MSGHILWTEPQEEVVRKPMKESWCFTCRARRTFVYVVMAPIEPSYYGPQRSIRCAACDTVDGDVFPGGEREWED